ncbi:SPOR domain-containing protein [uncultured Desulfosarcina sp.]|uniref:SPOR domain-containing protein n=1 Tax=uncultured Desulfosarcina sp. TaxID=218289 RepID=UPI0029C73ADE|nr:SPOR domain-containing protein [uncultured Desulfosarcina sp.]
MGYLFKHLTVRLWTTLTFGSLVALVALPPLAAVLGPGWMVVPALVLFALAFWLAGAALAALGRRRMARLLEEATVWDRAGMHREARQAFARAADTVDSFLFSPFSKKVPAERLLAKMARFQLARTAPEASSDDTVDAYLRRFPRDREAAVKWLEKMVAGKEPTAASHDIAARIGAAHPENAAIQRMLARFYLAEGRCDFSALQAYEYLMKSEDPPGDDLLGPMAELFLAQPRVDFPALTVYLACVDGGDRDPRLLSAIAACQETIFPGPENLPTLERAEAVLSGLDAARRHRMAAEFMPRIAEPGQGPPVKTASRRLRAMGKGLRNTLSAALRAVSHAGYGLRRLLTMLSTGPAKSVLKWSAMGLLAIGVGWMVVSTAIHLAGDDSTAEKIPPPAVAPVTDPFTLQVAAYLKETDARRYVDQLKDKGLDAYWTRASSGSKTWYQVRVAHYPTKAEARSIGEDLKKRGWIGDYYVANYKRPDVP